MPRQTKGTSSPADRPSLDEPRRSREWMVVLAITLAGIALRVWQPSHMAVEHFDEGVYTSNILCPFNGDRYPFRHLYAPPLLPFLMEWTLILSGMTASSVMWVNVIAGCVMVPSVWWVSRQWFGPIAGLTSATLAAFSEVHILFSRTALTDVLLCLWMLWAVYWAWRAILTGRPRAIFLAGLFASLAWWTKYNGWLALAISGSGTLAWIIAPRITPARLAAHFKCAAKRDDGPSAGRAMLRWSLVAVIAIVGWLPVLVDLQQYGGYVSVSANHAGYFVGLDGWWGSLVKQLENIRIVSPAWTWVGIGLAGLIVTHPHQTIQTSSFARQLVRFVLALCLVVLIELADYGLVDPVALLGILAVIGLALGLFRIENTNAICAVCAVWLVSAWFVGLLVATPLYTPFLRLTLPFVVACWLGVGVLFEHVRRYLTNNLSVSNDMQVGDKRLDTITIYLEFAVLVGITLVAFHGGNRAWQDRRGLQAVAAEIVKQVTAHNTDPAVSVLGEPGLFYHLGLQRVEQSLSADDLVIVPAADYGAATVSSRASVFLVTGPHSPSLLEQTNEVQQRLSLVVEWPYHPTLLVRLDQQATGNVIGDRAETEPIRLYRVTP